MSRNACDSIPYVFVPFWAYHVNSDELKLYRALAFAQSNFPETLVNTLLYVSLSLCKWKKRTASLYLSVAILISYYYRISLSYFFFFCRNHIVMIFSRGRKDFVKNYFMFVYNYIKIEINILAWESTFFHI